MGSRSQVVLVDHFPTSGIPSPSGGRPGRCQRARSVGLSGVGRSTDDTVDLDATGSESRAGRRTRPRPGRPRGRFSPASGTRSFDLRDDPTIPLVEFRRLIKDAGDLVLAAQLRVFVNALVYGAFCRFDPVRLKVDGKWVDGERPGPWVSSCVQAEVD